MCCARGSASLSSEQAEPARQRVPRRSLGTRHDAKAPKEIVALLPRGRLTIRRCAMPVILRTMPPGRFVILYDGHCRFCTAGSRRLASWMRGTVEQADFQQPGILQRFPGLTHEKCME